MLGPLQDSQALDRLFGWLQTRDAAKQYVLYLPLAILFAPSISARIT